MAYTVHLLNFSNFDESKRTTFKHQFDQEYWSLHYDYDHYDYDHYDYDHYDYD